MGGGNPGGSEIMPGGMPISDIFSIMDFGIICQHNSLISHVFIKSVNEKKNKKNIKLEQCKDCIQMMLPLLT